MSSPCTRQREHTGLQTDRRHVAVVDPGSSVLPFDYYFCRAHLERGVRVTLLASETRYNSEFLSELESEERADVKLWKVSSTVASRFRGVFNYLCLLAYLIFNMRAFDAVYYNFPRNWLLESVIFQLLGARTVFCIHNAVPHGTSSKRHFGTLALALSARQLMFVSHWTKRDFMSRYGSRFEKSSDFLQHGIMGIDPLDQPREYQLVDRFRGVAFWGNVKPYKGLEAFQIEPTAWLPTAVDHRYLIAGKWDPQISQLKAEYQLRPEIELREGFLSRDAVKELLAQDFIFILPYQQASQSGILYTLLFYGRFFIATDRGDIGDFLKDNGLQELIIADFSEAEMRRAVRWLVDHLGYVRTRLASAQQAYTWKVSN